MLKPILWSRSFFFNSITKLKTVRSQKYDISQFDAFCICLECSKGSSINKVDPYSALCDWILQLSVDLIQPKLPTFQIQPNSCIIPLTQFSKSTLQYPQDFDEKFRYFTKLVCKAKIWDNGDGALFKRLQARTKDLMESLAVLCDER